MFDPADVRIVIDEHLPEWSWYRHEGADYEEVMVYAPCLGVMIDDVLHIRPEMWDRFLAHLAEKRDGR